MFTVFHILAGTIALLAGAVSFTVRKGSPLHKSAGRLFVVSMLVMALTGAGLAWQQNELQNLVAGLVTFYLVATAFLTVLPVKPCHNGLHWSLMSYGVLIGGYAVYTAISHLNLGITTLDGNPIHVMLFFGSITLLGTVFDLRFIRQGRLPHPWRLVRHVWRIGLAMLIATVSFFLGQSQVIADPLRHWLVLLTPVILVLVLTLYWLIHLYWQGIQAKKLNRGRS